VYLIIEHTEALHVIDVNSGNRSNKANQEDTAMEVNDYCRNRKTIIAL
jgi:ribonuclease G